MNWETPLESGSLRDIHRGADGRRLITLGRERDWYRYVAVDVQPSDCFNMKITVVGDAVVPKTVVHLGQLIKRDRHISKRLISIYGSALLGRMDYGLDISPGSKINPVYDDGIYISAWRVGVVAAVHVNPAPAVLDPYPSILC